MQELLDVVNNTKELFKEKLLKIEETNSFTKDLYVRYLSMQHHLTKDVQKYFYAAASHAKIIKNKKLRDFLVNFANEEYPHYLIAQKDIENLGEKIWDMPFDTELWHSYFWNNVHDRPFIRLGATCILENISEDSNEVIDRLFSKAPFLNKNNTIFFTIHKHDQDLPHGDEILEALSGISGDDYQELIEGAKKASTLYLRMVDSVISGQIYL